MEKLIELLHKILFEKKERKACIKEFQEIVWNMKASDARVEILKEMAYDLDFYQPDSKLRYEEDAYYGDERLEEEVAETLKRIKSLGKP